MRAVRRQRGSQRSGVRVIAVAFASWGGGLIMTRVMSLLRVIAGTHRGRRLAAPPGRGTRPMLDRVREAIFGRLAPWFAPDEAPRVLDLFAGSGSLGIEALSRGAAFARFVERGREAGEVLAKNLRDLDLDEHAELLAADALSGAAREGGPWDVVFYDPPYPLLAVGGDGPAARDAVLGLV